MIGAVINTVSFPISRFMGFFFLWVSCDMVCSVQVSREFQLRYHKQGLSVAGCGYSGFPECCRGSVARGLCAGGPVGAGFRVRLRGG